MKRSLLFFILSIILTGCNYYLEDPGPTFTKPQNYTTDDGVNIKITPVSKIGDHRVSRYLTAFYVDINNGSGKTIEFGNEDIAVIDQINNQYNTLDPEYAASIIRENSAPVIYPRISVGIGGGYFHDDFWVYGHHHHWPYGRYHYYHDYYYDDYYFRPANVDFIYRNALIPGTVKSGARLAGFVYFNKLPKTVQSVKLLIGFDIVGTTEHKELTFEFAE